MSILKLHVAVKIAKNFIMLLNETVNLRKILLYVVMLCDIFYVVLDEELMLQKVLSLSSSENPKIHINLYVHECPRQFHG